MPYSSLNAGLGFIYMDMLQNTKWHAIYHFPRECKKMFSDICLLIYDNSASRFFIVGIISFNKAH